MYLYKTLLTIKLYLFDIFITYIGIDSQVKCTFQKYSSTNKNTYFQKYFK